jgi:hypothetical protein
VSRPEALADLSLAWEFNEPMALMLTYDGPLPTGNARSSVSVKNQIRRQLHIQLAAFCSVDARFNQLLVHGSGLSQAIGGVRFDPLIHSPYWAEIRVEMMRREPPGNIITSGGDLDGRLKTLFDGLRMPHHESEVDGFDEKWGRCICLLEDDALISRVVIDTRQMFRPLRDGEAKTDVQVRIDVTVEQYAI